MGMDKNVKLSISIIVPFYNSSGYLDRCLKSLVTQTYSEFEIICVDDGSTDGTLSLLKVWEKKDKRIIVRTQKNSGLSAARNLGIKLSTGDFITFVDSDDYVAVKYLEHLVAGISIGADISMVNKLLVFDGIVKKGGGNPHDEIRLMDTKAGIISVLAQFPDHEAWGKLFRKTLFDNTLFVEGKLFEDLGTVYGLLCKASKIAFYNRFDYFYVQRKDSIMNRSFDVKKMDVIEMGHRMAGVVLNKFPELVPFVMGRLFAAYSNVWLNIDPKDTLNRHHRETLWSNIVKCRSSMKITKINNKKVLFGYLISMFGQSTFRWIYLVRKS